MLNISATGGWVVGAGFSAGVTTSGVAPGPFESWAFRRGDARLPFNMINPPTAFDQNTVPRLVFALAATNLIAADRAAAVVVTRRAVNVEIAEAIVVAPAAPVVLPLGDFPDIVFRRGPVALSDTGLRVDPGAAPQVFGPFGGQADVVFQRPVVALSDTGRRVDPGPAPQVFGPFTEQADIVRAVPRPDTVSAWAGPQRQPDVQIFWFGQRTDVVRDRPRPEAAQFLGVPTRQPDPPALAWLGWHPDHVDPPLALRPAAQQAYTAPARQPDPPALSWVGWQPTSIDRLTLRLASWFAGPDRQPDPPGVAWVGSWPDMAPPAPALRAAAQQFAAAPTRQPDPPARAWAGWWPDTVPAPPALRTAAQQATAAPTRQPDPPSLVWRGWQPDIVDPRLSLRTAAQLAFAGPVQQPTPPFPGWVGWQPVAVDPPKGLRAALQRAFAAPDNAPEAPFPAWVGWRPEVLTVSRNAALFAGGEVGPGASSVAGIGPPIVSFPDLLRSPVNAGLLDTTAGTVEAGGSPPLSPTILAPVDFSPLLLQLHALRAAQQPSGPVGPVLPPAALTGGRDVAVHVPDEIAPFLAQGVSVELIVTGTPVLWDAPGPSLRVYHLNTAGAQVTDFPLTVMPQNGGNASYTLPWTPTTPGVYMFDIRGSYLGFSIQKVQAVTVRSIFDPIAIALHDIFVNRTQIS